jgi:hypothetical protein
MDIWQHKGFLFMSSSKKLKIFFLCPLSDSRYNHVENANTWQPEEKAEMTESFELLDRAASNEIHLQRCLLRMLYLLACYEKLNISFHTLQGSLSAYQIEDSIEKALAFASFIMDINDKEMFFSKTSTRAPEMLLQTPAFYKKKYNLSNSDTDDSMDCSTNQETVSVQINILIRL